MSIILEVNLESSYLDHSDKGEAKRIAASEKIRSDISLESNIYKMLDLALLCIYTLTNDNVFYVYNRKKVLEYICTYKSS